MIVSIDGKPHLRPCRSIPSEGLEHNEYVPVPIAVRYAELTKALPLSGIEVLGRSRSGEEPKLAAALRAEAPWMEAAIDRIASQLDLAAWTGQPWLSLRPMLLVGPAGAGKSHFARRLGELSGCGSAALSFAGVSSNAELAGNPRGFKHAQPSFPACAMQRLCTANPVVVIDEVEKSAGGSMGDPLATLLPMLERSDACRYFDGCLMAEIDLSHVNWILTANSTARMPGPLLSRLDVIDVTGPGPEHAELVLANLWRAVAADVGLPPNALPRLEKAAEAMLLRLLRGTRSVRRVRRAMEGVLAIAVRHQPRTLN